MKDYRRYSYWLDTVRDDLTPRPPMDGSLTVDIAILGAGFTSLWTAYYLLLGDPTLRIAIVEKEIAGFGAAGRNGGWCTSQFQLDHGAMKERFGREMARELQLALYDTVDEVGRVADRERIPAQFRKGGALMIARGENHRPTVLRAVEQARLLGLEDHHLYLDATDTSARIRVTSAVGSLFEPDCAVVHPGELVRGLARTVERMGARVYEGTEVRDIVAGASPYLVTAGGIVRARALVIGAEAYVSRFPALHRQLVPIYSLIVTTEPLSDDRWREIGWEGNECVSSCRYTVDYLSRTVDGRILFGGRGAPYHIRSRIEDRYDSHQVTHAMLRNMARTWFAPSLAATGFSHAWGGPLGMPRDWLPNIWFDPQQGLAFAGGYTGQGVAMANLAGRILAQLITGQDSRLVHLPIAEHRSKPWEPEPLRYLGIRYVQRSLMHVDDRSERTGIPPAGATLAERLAQH